jgi:hypothetical protein
MTSRSSIRAGGGWRVRVALLLALALAIGAAATAPSAQALSSALFCPTSGTISLGAGQAGCSGTTASWLQRVSFFQVSPSANHCAVVKESPDPDSAVLVAAVCGAGSGTDAEVYVNAYGAYLAFPRGRNDTGSRQNGYYGRYYW